MREVNFGAEEVTFVISKIFGHPVIHIAEQVSQPLLSICEDIFNPVNYYFFLLSFIHSLTGGKMEKKLIVSTVLTAHE